MATKQSKHASGRIQTPEPMGQEVITVYESLALAVGDIALNGVIQLFKLPAGCVPVGYKISPYDADSGVAAIAADFGLLDTAGTAVSSAAADGGKWLTASALLQAATLVTSDASKTTFDALKSVAPSTVDRIVGFVITTAAATAVAGTMGVEFSYKAAN